MSVATSEYLEAVEHLPAKGALLLDGVPWEEYEELLQDLGPDDSTRVFYDQGRMIVMPPLPEHERPKVTLSRLVGALSEELKLAVLSFGSSTLKRARRGKGAEPDDCFYVREAAQLLGKKTLDLDNDPPPDIVVEIDHTNSSRDKFPIYAGLGVPEIWRLVGAQMQIYLLVGDDYQESAASGVFPFLTAKTLSYFLDLGLTQGEWVAVPAFREWLKQNYPSNP